MRVVGVCAAAISHVSAALRCTRKREIERDDLVEHRNSKGRSDFLRRIPPLTRSGIASESARVFCRYTIAVGVRHGRSEKARLVKGIEEK